MRFISETPNEMPQGKAVAGQYLKVAVGCWFTVSGKSMPWIIKYEDSTGYRHTLNNIRVLSTEQKHYAGILLHKYRCRVEINDRSQEITLLYHPGENIWDMVIGENE